MTLLNFKHENNASSLMVGTISAGATSCICTATEGALFPSTYPFLLTLEAWSGSVVTKREIVRCTGRTSDTFTIVRSAGDCPASDSAVTQTNTAFSFDSGSEIVTIKHKATAEDFNDINAELVRLEDEKLPKSTYNAEKQLFGASSVGTDAYAITSSDVTSYVNGQTYKIQADVANTGACTLTLNALSAKAIEKLEEGAFVPLITGDIIANQIFWATYNSVEDCFQFSVDPATVVTGTTPKAFELHNALFPIHASTEAYHTAVNCLPLDAAKYTTATGIAITCYANGIWFDPSTNGRLELPVMGPAGNLAFNSGKNVVMTMACIFPSDSTGPIGFGFSTAGNTNWDTTSATVKRFGFTNGSGPAFKAATADGTTHAASSDLDSHFSYDTMVILQIFWDATTNMAYFYINGTQRAALSTNTLGSLSGDIYLNFAYGNGNAYIKITEFILSIEK